MDTEKKRGRPKGSTNKPKENKDEKIRNPLTGKMVSKAYYNNLVRSGKLKTTEISGNPTKLKSASPEVAGVSPKTPTRTPLLKTPPAKTSRGSLLGSSASSSAKSKSASYSSSKSSSSSTKKPDLRRLLNLFPEDVQEQVREMNSDADGGYDIYDYLDEMKGRYGETPTYKKYIKIIEDYELEEKRYSLLTENQKKALVTWRGYYVNTNPIRKDGTIRKPEDYTIERFVKDFEKLLRHKTLKKMKIYDSLKFMIDNGRLPNKDEKTKDETLAEQRLKLLKERLPNAKVRSDLVATRPPPRPKNPELLVIKKKASPSPITGNVKDLLPFFETKSKMGAKTNKKSSSPSKLSKSSSGGYNQSSPQFV